MKHHMRKTYWKIRLQGLLSLYTKRYRNPRLKTIIKTALDNDLIPYLDFLTPEEYKQIQDFRKNNTK